jgi:hypothetical protein
MYKIVLPNEVDLVIVSYGGVGTSFLMDFFSQYLTINHPHDKDGFKHSPLPPISFNPNVKFMYVYGNPQMAAASLFRRNFHTAQSFKLQRWGRKVVPIPMEMTIQEYAHLGIDRFCFENHFQNWYRKYLTGIPTLFVRYETIFDNVRHLLEFTEIPEDSIEKFPPKKQRNSKKEEISVETASLLDQMYGDFADQLDKLDDIEIRQAGTRRVLLMKQVNLQYGMAIAEQVKDQAQLLVRNQTAKLLRNSQKPEQPADRSP